MAQPRRDDNETSDLRGGARILIVEARFYHDVADALLEGATRALNEAGATFDKLTVPGALEIPAAIAIALDAAKADYDGVVALGCVVRGDTFHFEIVAGESARALMDLSVSRKIPLGNGILTVDTDSQANARANPDEGDKGGDAARAALAMLRLKRGVEAR